MTSHRTSEDAEDAGPADEGDRRGLLWLPGRRRRGDRAPGDPGGEGCRGNGGGEVERKRGKPERENKRGTGHYG